MVRVTATIGAYVGCINAKTGKLLLVRRTERGSLTGESFLGNWELPGGGVEEAESVPYDHLLYEALRELREETGIDEVPDLDLSYPFYPVLFRSRDGEYDLAGVFPLLTGEEPTKGVTRWVSTEELNQLAREFLSPKDAKAQGLAEARGLLSGWGKRMHVMTLCALVKSVDYGITRFDIEAGGTLVEIFGAVHPD